MTVEGQTVEDLRISTSTLNNRSASIVTIEPIFQFFSFPLLGGRYKKEVLVDGQSNLLLIREESGLPTAQVCKRSPPMCML